MPPQEAFRITHPTTTVSADATMMMVSSETTSFSGAVCSNSSNGIQCSTSLLQDQQTLEELRDVIEALKVQEASYNNCSKTENNDSFPLFFDSWRPVMVSWMYSVIDTFALNPICVPTGMYYLDTCSSTLINQTKRNDGKELYPLMAMTALNLAVKCHETRMFPLDQLVQLLGRRKDGKGGKQSGQEHMRYTPEDIIEMERVLLRKCQWKLHPPTTHDFLHQFVQVLDSSIRKDVLECAMVHVKNALMWEHVLHQQQKQQQTTMAIQHPQQLYRPFLSSTLAYASLLLAMEEKQLPLADKQACCLALLQVADLSTHTPHLSKAYNWLLYSKNLQAQLVAANQRQQQQPSPSTIPATPSAPPMEASRIVSPTTTATVSTGHAVQSATKDDFQPPRPMEASTKPHGTDFVHHGSSVPIVSPAPSTATTANSTTMEDASCCNGGGSMVVEETTVSIKTNAWEKQQQHCCHSSHSVEDDPLFQEDSSSSHDEDDDEEDDDDLSEVIFYSHTFTGDGFEVMTVDMDENIERGDDQGADMTVPPHSSCNERSQQHPSLLASPASTELSIADLILTESLDEDGFEVSYTSGVTTENTLRKSTLANMLASPTDVVA